MSDDRRPKILLSLDGGGVKGLSQLDIIAEIIRRIKDKLKADSGNRSLAADEGLQDDQIYPCEYFDLIVGSGTGGINAILIGRLGLSIKQCIEAWEGLDDVFKVDYDRADEGSLFSADKLETWAKDLVNKHTGSPDTMMLIKKEDMEKPNFNRKSSRVGVTSMRAQNIGLPAVFRSYRVRANAGIDCAIWEVLRATTAAPLLFKSVFIGRKWAKQEFINAELGANNPISYLFQEKQKVWLRKDNWPPPEIGCVISVGSGKDSVISLPSEPEEETSWTRWFRSKPDFDLAEKLYGVMLRIAKDCERKHQEVEATYGPDEEKVYFRLNVEQGMQDLPENTYDEETRVKIKAQVASYLAHGEFGIYVEGLIDKIVEVRGTVDPGQEEVVPAYEPPAGQSQSQNQNQAIIEKAKGMARDLGATSNE